MCAFIMSLGQMLDACTLIIQSSYTMNLKLKRTRIVRFFCFLFLSMFVITRWYLVVSDISSSLHSCLLIVQIQRYFISTNIKNVSLMVARNVQKIIRVAAVQMTEGWWKCFYVLAFFLTNSENMEKLLTLLYRHLPSKYSPNKMNSIS